MDEVIVILVSLFSVAVLNGAPLLYGTLGEILTERAGGMNLGVEGMMFMGGAFGLAGAFYYEKIAGASFSGFAAVAIAVLCAFLAGAAGGLLFAVITVTFRAPQNVTGLALSIFGVGLGQFAGEYISAREGGYVAVSGGLKAFFQNSPFPASWQELPVVGRALFGYHIFVYLGVALAIGLSLYLNRTRSGLHLRAAGEHPAAADAAGVPVLRYKYWASAVGGGITGVGGMVHIMTIAGCVWSHEGLAGVGWLAVALVIFCIWRPLWALWGSLLFGELMVLYLRFAVPFFPTQLYRILPYVVAVLVLIVISVRGSKSKKPPMGLGIPYFREER